METEDYPKDFQEFIDRFKTNDDCWEYLFKIRWVNGYTCPKCRNAKYYLNNRKLAECKNCGHQTSVTAGTIFHGSRKSLLLWFHVMWWVAAQKTGVSASNFKDFMGFGSYETAWAWLHKLRRTMIRPGRELLSGEVEVDETFIGGKETGEKEDGTNKTGRGSSEKSLVVVATECHGKQIGRVRFKCIDSASGNNLVKFIEDNNDSLANKSEYKHVRKPVSGSGQEAHELLPHVHMVDSLLKRWMNGTHQGRISQKHLGFYLDEYAFRFNRKLSTHRGKVFYRLVQQSVITGPAPLKDLMNNEKHNT